jgi:hypothetical protein
MPTPISRELRIRRWLIVTVATLVGVGVAVMISLYLQRDSLIRGCERNSKRAALSANLALHLSERVGARGQKGDAKSAAEYAASGYAFIEDIPGYDGDLSIVQVEKVVIGGRDVYRLTQKAERIQAQGCTDAFPRPIPFVQ